MSMTPTQNPWWYPETIKCHLSIPILITKVIKKYQLKFKCNPQDQRYCIYFKKNKSNVTIKHFLVLYYHCVVLSC